VRRRKASARAADSANTGRALQRPGEERESQASTPRRASATLPIDRVGTELALYDEACRAIAAARSVNEILQIRDVARQLEACARVAKNRDAEADAVAIRLRAVRRLGQLQQAQKETVGLNRGAAGGGKKAGPRGRLINPRDLRPTLASQGIDKSLAQQARVLGALSDEKFEAVVDDARAKHARAVRNAVREVEILQERENYRARTEQGCVIGDLEALATSGFRAGVIAPDFPWPFDVYSGKGKQRSADRHYDTWPLERIFAMAPLINKLAADACALLLWAVWPQLPAALKFIEACGFKFKSDGFTWVKTNPGVEVIKLDGKGLHWGMGYGTRANTEVCLLAIRGEPVGLSKDVHQVVIAPVGEHSEKPDEVYRRIERLYPGPYLELFARRPREHWAVWGDEIPRGQMTRENASKPSAAAAAHDDLDLPEFLRRVPAKGGAA
jgi:N6-adenosine-specific RNA methylase IME4